MSEVDHYPLTVRPLDPDEGGGYLCEFPDLPGCMGDGATPEEAIADGKQALRATLETLRELGREAPPPSSPTGEWRVQAPKSLHRRLAARAKREGVSLNLLTVSLLSEALGARDAPVPACASDEPPEPSAAPRLKRIIGNIGDAFDPLRRLVLVFLVGGHGPVAFLKRVETTCGSRQIIQGLGRCGAGGQPDAGPR